MIGQTGTLPDEVAIALVLNGSTVAVLMATPRDLPALLCGFAVGEGIVTRHDHVSAIEVIPHPNGIEVRGRIPADRAAAIDARRRASVGPVGCGLCGIESLDMAMAEPPKVGPANPALACRVRDAVTALDTRQVMRKQSHAMHAAGYFDARGLVTLREDVGRHNALDKLIGAMGDTDVTCGGVVMTARLSIDLVQKCAHAGIPALYSVSRPTKAAVTQAIKCGMSLCTVAPDGLIFYAGKDEETTF